MRETALANGQRSQWVGRFMRVRPSVPTRDYVHQRVAQAIEPCPSLLRGGVGDRYRLGHKPVRLRPLDELNVVMSGLNVQSGHRKRCAGRHRRLVNLVDGSSDPVQLVAYPEAQPLSQQRERCSARRRSHTRTLVDGADLPNWWGLCSAAAASINNTFYTWCWSCALREERILAGVRQWPPPTRVRVTRRLCYGRPGPDPL